MTIYKYPLAAPVISGGNKTVEAPTEAIDYLCLKRSRIIYEKGKAGSHHRFNADTGITDVKRKRNKDVAYLAMPPQLSTSYQAAYSHQDLGVVGLGLADSWNQGNMDKLAETISAAAGMGLPEFASATATSLANNFGNMLGVAGKMDANSLQQLTKGRVFNPFAEQIFKSMAFRQHQFNFKLIAKSYQEAVEIYDMINWIKRGATPKIQSGSDDKDLTGPVSDKWKYSSQYQNNEKVSNDKSDGSKNISKKYEDMLEQSKNQRFFEIPDHFDLKFMRVNPNANESNWWNPTQDFNEGEATSTMHFKIHSSFCNNVGVNYTPDGQYTSFKHIRNGGQMQVPVIALSLQFIETRLVSQQDISRGY